MSSYTCCQSSILLSTILNVNLKISEVKNPRPLIQQAARLYVRKRAADPPNNIQRDGKLMVRGKQPVKIQGLNFLDGSIKKTRVCGGIKSIEAAAID